jgi:hypothetical protein
MEEHSAPQCKIAYVVENPAEAGRFFGGALTRRVCGVEGCTVTGRVVLAAYRLSHHDQDDSVEIADKTAYRLVARSHCKYLKVTE